MEGQERGHGDTIMGKDSIGSKETEGGNSEVCSSLEQCDTNFYQFPMEC